MTATQWMLMTLLPCGMPSTGSDRLLSTVMEEIDGIPTPSPTLTPEEVERISRLNEARWPVPAPDPIPPAADPSTAGQK